MTKPTTRILLVEDNEAHAELLCRAFDVNPSGFRVSVVDTLQKAREYLSESMPDLIIADFLLPDGKGIELLQAAEEKPHVPFVVMTSHGNEQVAVEVMKAGAFDYIVKSSETLMDMPHIAERVLREWVNIRERERAEEALRESQEKYRLLVENANDAIFIIQDEVVKFSNPKLQQLTGYSVDELSKMPIIDVVHPEDRNMVLERHRKRLKGENPPSTYSYRIINRDGKEYRVQLNTVLITWEGQPATLNIIRDITEQKKMEAQLQQSQKMEAIGTLAGGIAHDFNNILAIILGNAELAMSDIPERNPAQLNLEAVQTASLRARDLVRQLLSFSRMAEQERTPLKINTIVKESLKLLRSTIPATIEILQDIPNDIDTILADPTQVHQIVLNLSTNAAHAMQQHGGILEVALAAIELDEDTSMQYQDISPGKYVKLMVRDSGHGIDPDILGKIFDPYFTTKKVGHGTGMGLAVIHGIVKSYGGGFLVQSEPGKGTTFNILLPVIDEEATIEAKPVGDIPSA